MSCSSLKWASRSDFIKDIRKNLDRDAHFKLLHDNPKAKFATAEDVLENMEKTAGSRQEKP
ncbi:MAG TPA: hypothetical protein GX520_00115, partial [Syntrophaceticus sp.]|nr:hypothetical protein [Syntrophaceticus sp.]